VVEESDGDPDEQRRQYCRAIGRDRQGQRHLPLRRRLSPSEGEARSCACQSDPADGRSGFIRWGPYLGRGHVAIEAYCAGVGAQERERATSSAIALPPPGESL